MSAPVTDWRADARRMRAAGATYKEIAGTLGVPITSVYRACNPEITRQQNLARRDEKREWENAHRASCARCGQQMGAGTAHSDGSRTRNHAKGDICKACITVRRVDLVLEMWRLRVERGALNVEIARELDVPVGTVTTELYRLRALGYDVPKSRYRGADRRPTTAAVLDEPALTLGRQLRARGIYPTSVAA